jgi:transcriptional regulator with XRE-family HTH domain
VAEPVPNPKRITLALDAKGLYGPDVDRACGVEEPAVDQWETGELVPTPEQLVKLAALTGVTVGFFFGDDPPHLGRVFICDRSRRKHGLTVIEPDGTVSVDPPPRRRKAEEDAMPPSAHPRVPRRGRQPTRRTRHAFIRDHTVPLDVHEREYCKTCGRPGKAGDANHLTDDETAAQRQYEQRRLGEHD